MPYNPVLLLLLLQEPQSHYWLLLLQLNHSLLMRSVLSCYDGSLPLFTLLMCPAALHHAGHSPAVPAVLTMKDHAKQLAVIVPALAAGPQ